MDKESCKSRAYRAIRDRIISGALRPGDGLDRRTMAASLGMSVAPVLEAIKLHLNSGKSSLGVE